MTDIAGRVVTEEGYMAARGRAVEALVELLKVADALGKEQQLVAMEVLGLFQKAAEEALA